MRGFTLLVAMLLVVLMVAPRAQAQYKTVPVPAVAPVVVENHNGCFNCPGPAERVGTVVFNRSIDALIILKTNDTYERINRRNAEAAETINGQWADAQKHQADVNRDIALSNDQANVTIALSQEGTRRMEIEARRRTANDQAAANLCQGARDCSAEVGTGHARVIYSGEGGSSGPKIL